MGIISDYLSSVENEADRAALRHVCAIVLQAVPDATEAIAYNLPVFKKGDEYILGFSAGKKFLSIYPFSGSVFGVLKTELAGYEQTKGSLHFTPEHPISDALLQRILAVRLAEIATKKP